MQDCLKIAEFRLFGEGANCHRTHVSPHNNLRFESHSSLVLDVHANFDFVEILGARHNVRKEVFYPSALAFASFPVWKDSGNFAEKAKFIFYE